MTQPHPRVLSYRGVLHGVSEVPTREGAIVAAAGGLAENWVAIGSADDAERRSDRETVRRYAESIGGDIDTTTAEVDSVATSLIDRHRAEIEQLAAILSEQRGRIRSFEIAAVTKRLDLSCPLCSSN